VTWMAKTDAPAPAGSLAARYDEIRQLRAQAFDRPAPRLVASQISKSGHDPVGVLSSDRWARRAPSERPSTIRQNLVVPGDHGPRALRVSSCCIQLQSCDPPRA
jgi:hypothetical protein